MTRVIKKTYYFVFETHLNVILQNLDDQIVHTNVVWLYKSCIQSHSYRCSIRVQHSWLGQRVNLSTLFFFLNFKCSICVQWTNFKQCWGEAGNQIRFLQEINDMSGLRSKIAQALFVCLSVCLYGCLGLQQQVEIDLYSCI